MPAATPSTAPDPWRPPLLRLPPSIRRRIYLYLGLASWNGYPNTVDLHGRNPSFGESLPPDGVRGLLLCCRTVYTEAAALVYSANRFIIYYSKPGSFAPLLALTPSSLACLASLKVILNEAACHEPSWIDATRSCCRYRWQDPDSYSSPIYCKKNHIGAHSRPLTSRTSPDNGEDSPAGRVLLSEWHAAAAYLSSHLKPGQLELSLVCDIDHRPEDAREMARSVVAPFQLLPRLRNCRVRLCDVPDPGLQQLAQDAVLQAGRVVTPYSKPLTTQTTFVTLPRESRLRILEHTDLITPHREVSWSRAKPAYLVLEPRCTLSDWGECRFHRHNGCQFFRCWNTPRPQEGCFCRRRHSASSPTCRCWCPPGPALFLVSRTLCLDAQLVFFSGNRFIVHDHDSGFPFAPPLPPGPPLEPGADDETLGYYPWERFSVSLFLKNVVPRHCLSHLRFLEVVFPPYCHGHWPAHEHPAMEDWYETVRWLRDEINAPGLTVWMIMTGPLGEDLPLTDRETLTRRQGQAVFKSYMQIVWILKTLVAGADGLAGVYVQLAHALARTPEMYGRAMRHDGWAWIKRKEQKDNDWTERQIMGERYDALYANGKERPAKSIWQLEPGTPIPLDSCR